MVAFEISINGKPLSPMESPGFGMLSVNIWWATDKLQNGAIHEIGRLARNGTKKGQDTEVLPIEDLKVGDEITIRLVMREPPNLPSPE